MKKIKNMVLMLVMFLMMSILPMSVYAIENGQISLQTTLTGGITVKGSKKTFDVIARLDNKKIPSEVTLNGKKVDPNWDDQNKTSYTIKFSQEGKNIIVVNASYNEKKATKTYIITYKKANKGELIGYSTWSIEALTIGRGFLVDPIKVPIYEGENSAQMLDRVLTQNGYSYRGTGTLKGGFYLSAIGDGGTFKKGCSDSSKARSINISTNIEDKIPSGLKTILNKEEKWPPYELDRPQSLGEFDYTNMSGWMYSINNVFPNVGFSDSYPQDEDVVRVQFTLFGYGADIGGGYAMGGENTDFYKVANKDRLLSLLSSNNKEKVLARENIKMIYNKAMKVATELEATQNMVDEACLKLEQAIKRG